MLPQWLCGVTLKYPAYFWKLTNKQKVKLKIKQQLLQKSKAMEVLPAVLVPERKAIRPSRILNDDYHTRKRIEIVNKKHFERGF